MHSPLGTDEIDFYNHNFESYVPMSYGDVKTNTIPNHISPKIGPKIGSTIGSTIYHNKAPKMGSYQNSPPSFEGFTLTLNTEVITLILLFFILLIAISVQNTVREILIIVQQLKNA